MTFNPDIHHRRSIRLKNYDYSQAGAYFMTICTQNKECLFGDVLHGDMRLNDAGSTIQGLWTALPERFPSVELDEAVIMPNHMHGIVVFTGALFVPGIVGAPLAAPGIEVVPDSIATATKDKDESNTAKQKGAASSAPTLGDIIRAFKSMSAIAVNRVLERLGIPVWQRNYYEHIIRSEPELNKIREYIVNNSLSWETDENFKN